MSTKGTKQYYLTTGYLHKQSPAQSYDLLLITFILHVRLPYIEQLSSQGCFKSKRSHPWHTHTDPNRDGISALCFFSGPLRESPAQLCTHSNVPILDHIQYIAFIHRIKHPIWNRAYFKGVNLGLPLSHFNYSFKLGFQYYIILYCTYILDTYARCTALKTDWNSLTPVTLEMAEKLQSQICIV